MPINIEPPVSREDGYNAREIQLLGQIAGENAGDPVPVEAPVSRADRYALRQIELLEQIAQGGGGGGSSNSVVTVTGTMADPWGEAFADFATAAAADVNGVSADLAVDASALSMGMAYLQWDKTYTQKIKFSSTALGTSVAGSMAADVEYSTATGSMDSSRIMSGGEILDMAQYAAMLPATLTIIYHPLPDNGTEEAST